MRCSSFRLQLDAYVEGTLTPARRARIAAHLARCSECTALLAEFRVVDALLLTPRTLEPAANFTFKVMAEVRSLPPPRTASASLPAVLATYLAFGWITIGAFLIWGGGYARAMLTTIGQGVERTGALATALAGVTGRTFGAHAFDVTAAMGGLLGADVLIVAAVVALYALRRSRRAVAARVPERC